MEFEEIPSRWRDRQIPKLIVQPLLENAYQHGLEDRDGPGFIRVGFIENEQFLTIIVEDNGDLTDEQLAKINGLLAKKQSPGENAGLYNVKRRIQLYFGEEGVMVAGRSLSGGLRIELRLPTDKQGGE
ncbi:sensor histidine kinase [Cohnella sp.]|uniref:sensor histidine kinase n=1 Tax=Cohnella sp. TaxID=1883426 RepID=UPI00370423FF